MGSSVVKQEGSCSSKAHHPHTEKSPSPPLKEIAAGRRGGVVEVRRVLWSLGSLQSKARLGLHLGIHPSRQRSKVMGQK